VFIRQPYLSCFQSAKYFALFRGKMNGNSKQPITLNIIFNKHRQSYMQPFMCRRDSAAYRDNSPERG